MYAQGWRTLCRLALLTTDHNLFPVPCQDLLAPPHSKGLCLCGVPRAQVESRAKREGQCQIWHRPSLLVIAVLLPGFDLNLVLAFCHFCLWQGNSQHTVLEYGLDLVFLHRGG
jgi:hypothetical protein